MLEHKYSTSDDQFVIPQTQCDLVIGRKYFIPKGYVNATLMGKAHGKEAKGFLKTRQCQEYIEELNRQIKGEYLPPLPEYIETQPDLLKTYHEFISNPTSVITIKNQPGINSYESGIWVHYELAIKFAGYCSPKFEVWANRNLRLLIEGKFDALTPEAKAALQELKDSWNEVRVSGKIARKSFTDCIKDHIIHEQGETFYRDYRLSGKVFAKYTASVQRQITGMPNFQGNRDNCTKIQLELLQYFELQFCNLFLEFYPDTFSFDEVLERVIRMTKRQFKL